MPLAGLYLLGALAGEAKAAGVVGPLRALGLLAGLGVLAWWWPPVGGTVRFLAGALGVGGTREKKNAEKKNGTAETGDVPAGKAGRVELLSLGGEPRPRRWAVAGLVPYGPMPRWCVGRSWPPVWREQKGYVSAILGSGGVGKSYLLLSLAMAMLLDGEWLGQKVLRCKNVLYVDAELDLDTQKERGYQVARGLGLERPPGPAHWWQVPWSWVRPHGLHYLNLSASLASPEGQAQVAAAVKRTRAECVLFDSLTIGSFGAGLSDQNAWNFVLSGMERWGVPTVLIDHLNRQGAQSGSFMKHAKIRSMLLLKLRDGTVLPALVDVEHKKSNFAPMLPPFVMRPVFDGTPLAVRFDVATAGSGTTSGRAPSRDVPTPAPAQVCLDAWGTKGAATVAEIAEATGLAPQTVAKAKDALLKTKQLAKAGKATTGGRPGEVFMATGATLSPQALSTADALLLSALMPPVAGGAGGQGEAAQ